MIAASETRSRSWFCHDHVYGFAHTPLLFILQLQIWMQLTVLMLLLKIILLRILTTSSDNNINANGGFSCVLCLHDHPSRTQNDPKTPPKRGLALCNYEVSHNPPYSSLFLITFTIFLSNTALEPSSALNSCQLHLVLCTPLFSVSLLYDTLSYSPLHSRAMENHAKMQQLQ